jgi:hypothetical protein
MPGACLPYADATLPAFVAGMRAAPVLTPCRFVTRGCGASAIVMVAGWGYLIPRRTSVGGTVWDVAMTMWCTPGRGHAQLFP